MVRLSKILLDKNLLEDDKNFAVPASLVMVEFQEILFRYLSANLAFWDANIVKNILQGMRNAARTVFDMEPTDENLEKRYHFIQRTNGTLRWLSRLTRARQMTKLLDYLTEENKESLLGRDLNYSERQFGLRQRPTTNPLSVARRFATEYEIEPTLVEKFEDELNAYAIKYDINTQLL